jgi:hypothetical protein
MRPGIADRGGLSTIWSKQHIHLFNCDCKFRHNKGIWLTMNLLKSVSDMTVLTRSIVLFHIRCL